MISLGSTSFAIEVNPTISMNRIVTYGKRRRAQVGTFFR